MASFEIAQEDKNTLRIDVSLWLDLNRTGDLDQLVKVTSLNGKWKWGKRSDGGMGAVVLANHDDDESTKRHDFSDQRVNSHSDETDLAPICVRASQVLPSGWSVTLSATDHNHIRVHKLNSHSHAATQVFGKDVGDTYALTANDLTACAQGRGLTLFMEATQFPDGTFDGLIRLRLTVGPPPALAPAIKPVSDEAEVRVAPWMMPHHGTSATKVFVAALSDNARFRTELGHLVAASGATLTEIDVTALVEWLVVNNGDYLLQWCRYRGAKTLLQYDGGTGVTNAERIFKPGDLQLPDYAHKEAHTTLAAFANSFNTTEPLLGDLEYTHGQKNRDLPSYGDGYHGSLRVPPTVRVDSYYLQWLEWYAGAFGMNLLDFLSYKAAGTSIADQILDAGKSIAVDEMDRWAQDCMEIGYTSLPGHHIMSVVRASRDRTLHHLPRQLLAPEFGDYEPGDLSHGTTFDSHGNLEVTPPVTVSGKAYPWGRIYFCEGESYARFEPKVSAFLDCQIVQKPFRLKTEWLTVGHVDEVISFVPVPNAKASDAFPYRVLLASPILAWELIEQALKLVKATPPKKVGVMFQGRDLEGKRIETDLLDFELNGISKLANFSATKLKAWNKQAQNHLNAIRQTLKSELGITNEQIIRVPILYHQDPRSRKFDALTAAMVNMLVVNGHCIYPKPFGPNVDGKDLFAEDFEKNLKQLGLKPHGIDDWYEYHCLKGEVHCGTNTQRNPIPAKWWEFGGP